VTSLTWAQAAAWRMRAQGLVERAPSSEWLGVVERVCGLHAQVMSSAELTLWARVEGLDRRTVASALWESRALVKTWAMRGTLHLLPSEEYPIWVAALGQFDHYRRPGWLRGWGLTVAEMETLIEAVGSALDGEPVTRDVLGDEVERATGSEHIGQIVRGSWGSMLKPAAYQGRLCFGPSVGQKVTFTRPSAWLGADVAPADPDEALRSFTRRFLAANGPATREDYARWWGITPARAGERIAALGDEVEEVTVDGEPRWMLAGASAEAASCSPSGVVRLVPMFDQYVVGATLHAASLLPSPELRERVYRPQGCAVVLVDGRMDGVWRWERKGRRLVVAVEPFVPFGADVRAAVEAEVARLAGFLGGELRLEWTAAPT
jgi:winged helix DNA-binding protein